MCYAKHHTTHAAEHCIQQINPVLYENIAHIKMNIIYYALSILSTNLACLGQAKHEQMDVYHIHKGPDIPDESWTKVIQEWPDNPQDGVGMDQLNQKAMEKVLQALADMLQQLVDYRNSSATYIGALRTSLLFGDALVHSSQCVKGLKYNCRTLLDFDINLVIPGFSFIVHHSEYPFNCIFQIQPFYELYVQRHIL